MHTPRELAGLPAAWWVEPGRLAAGAYPGHPDPALEARQLGALLDAGVEVVVSLLEGGEAAARAGRDYRDALARLAAARGLRVAVHRHGIEDHDVPDAHTLVALETTLDAARRAGACVYLHCWGGRGRTGTVAALELVRRGLAPPSQALAAVATLRAGLPGSSPESPAQEAFVARWAGRRAPAPAPDARHRGAS